MSFIHLGNFPRKKVSLGLPKIGLDSVTHQLLGSFGQNQVGGCCQQPLKPAKWRHKRKDFDSSCWCWGILSFALDFLTTSLGAFHSGSLNSHNLQVRCVTMFFKSSTSMWSTEVGQLFFLAWKKQSEMSFWAQSNQSNQLVYKNNTFIYTTVETFESDFSLKTSICWCIETNLEPSGQNLGKLDLFLQILDGWRRQQTAWRRAPSFSAWPRAVGAYMSWWRRRSRHLM